MKVVWTDAEVNKIENTAYMTGIAVGEHMERARIIKLLEDDETLHNIWWIVYRDLKPFPDSGRLSQWEIAEVLKALLIKGEN